jgi:hypothetical protein
MNLKNIITSGLFILTVISLTAQTYKLKTKDITVSGNSTLHKWTSDITQASRQGVFQFEDNHPNVIYTFQGTDVITKTSSGYTIKVKGNLQIGGR